jgi:glycosyltransferase involved in cell wall biosynthesis
VITAGNTHAEVVFLWSSISGYMAACWRAIASYSQPQIAVFSYSDSTETNFQSNLMHGVPWTPLDSAERMNASLLLSRIRDSNPKVLIVGGWFNSAYRTVAARLAADGVRVVVGMDTPWQATPKQHLARWILYPFLRHASALFVPGERAWQYARRLGIPERRIYRGLYGIDFHTVATACDARRDAVHWPQTFLFIGRYAHEKGLDLLVEAYSRYRRQTTNPWELVCCGMGPLHDLLRNQPGIHDRGFLQPDMLHKVMADSAALVLPSRFDPWPLALVEGASAGLPIIASNACGSAVEVVRDGYSGYRFETGCTDDLGATLIRVHEQTNLREMGNRSRQLAAPYSAEQWARRVQAIVSDLTSTT